MSWHYFGYFLGVAPGFLGTFLGYYRTFGYHFWSILGFLGIIFWQNFIFLNIIQILGIDFDIFLMKFAIIKEQTAC